MATPPTARRLRGLSDVEVASVVGVTPAELRRAVRNLIDIAEADLPDETRSLLLETSVEGAGADPIGPSLADRILAEVPRPVRATDLLDVTGVGPSRFTRIIPALASADIGYLLDKADDLPAVRRLLTGLRPGRSRELVNLIVTDRAETVLGADFALLDEIEAIVRDPGRVSDAAFDADRFAAITEFVANLLPTVEFIAALYRDDLVEPPVEESEPIGDEPPPAVLDEAWPPPQDENPGTCPQLTLTFGPYMVSPPELGDLDGLREVLNALVEIQLAVGRLILTAVVYVDGFTGMLPEELRTQARALLNGLRMILPDPQPAPNDPQADDDLLQEAANTLERVRRALDRIVTADVTVRKPTRPASIISPKTNLDITGPAGSQVDLEFRSIIDSTYTYGLRKGTEYVGAPGDDRPWFAKVTIDTAARKVQLGAEGGIRTTPDGVSVTLPASGRLTLPVELVGNYGRARAIASLPGTPCAYGSPLFKIEGPFEEDIVAEVMVRFTNVDDTIRKIEDVADAITELVDFIKDALGAILVIGDVAAALIQAFKGTLRVVLQTLLERVRTLNDQQRKYNLETAVRYPERGPKGEREDDLPNLPGQ
jgi:hypothetical protein